MICLNNPVGFAPLVPHLPDIQRLRITMSMGYSADFRGEFPQDPLRAFTALRELQIAPLGPLMLWVLSNTTDIKLGNLPFDTVRWLDLLSGLLLTGSQLRMVVRWRVIEASRRKPSLGLNIPRSIPLEWFRSID
ncbi:hypothetical protein F5Y17DRAFT_17443 [Xylariaceae sp. FL0594]|nr:hypothetical protein F5Y17DRAFT_17443 [Xylariaceae sp. FL0594]